MRLLNSGFRPPDWGPDGEHTEDWPSFRRFCSRVDGTGVYEQWTDMGFSVAGELPAPPTLDDFS